MKNKIKKNCNGCLWLFTKKKTFGIIDETFCIGKYPIKIEYGGEKCKKFNCVSCAYPLVICPKPKTISQSLELDMFSSYKK